MNDPLVTLKKHAESVAAETLPPAAKARVRNRIERHLARPRRVVPWIVLALGLSGGAFAAQRSAEARREHEYATAVRSRVSPERGLREPREATASDEEVVATTPPPDLPRFDVDAPRESAPTAADRGKVHAADRLIDLTHGYREALAQRASSPDRALRAFRRLRQRFPDAPLRHEIDVHVVDLCRRLARRDELVAEAETFLRRYPESPRRNEVSQLLARSRRGERE